MQPRQAVIQTADEILAALQADAVFLQHLGSYSFKSGDTAPALVILGGNEQVPGVERINGLECVIARTPNVSSDPLLAGAPIVSKEWKIFLVQYEGANRNAVIEAADRLITLCPGAKYTQLASDLSDLAGIEQVVVTIPPFARFDASLSSCA